MEKLRCHGSSDSLLHRSNNGVRLYMLINKETVFNVYSWTKRQIQVVSAGPVCVREPRPGHKW